MSRKNGLSLPLAPITLIITTHHSQRRTARHENAVYRQKVTKRDEPFENTTNKTNP